MPIGLDWFQSILPAVQVFLAGGDPYAIAEGYYRAPFPFWTFIALAPFALLPYWIGRTLLFFASRTYARRIWTAGDLSCRRK